MSAAQLRDVPVASLSCAGSDRFVLRYVDAAGVVCEASLEAGAEVAFDRGRPVQEFPSYRGQRSWPGLWWSAPMGAHVGYESWLERDHVMALDFDSDVVALVSQPFWLGFDDDEGRLHPRL